MTSINDTLNQRQAVYGDFGRVSQAVQAFKSVARSSPSWPMMTATQREGTEGILLKLVRALYGDPMHMDNWHDIAGFATLIEEEFGVKKVEDMTPAPNPKEPMDLLLDHNSGIEAK